MKNAMFRFMFVVIITIFFNLAHIGSKLYAQQEVIYLPQGYEDVFYTYQFKAPDGYLKPLKWEVERCIHRQLNKMNLHFSISGKLSGIPTLGGEFSFNVKVSGKKEVKKKTEIYGGAICIIVTKKDVSKEFLVKLKIKRPPRWNSGENFRTLVGLEQSGASSATPQFKIFIDLYISNPLPFLRYRESKSELGDRFTLWGNIKVTSLPLQINSSLIQTPAAFEEVIKNLEINEVVRGVDFLAGFDWRIWEIPRKRPPIKGKRWYSFSLVGAYGATTPISPTDIIQIFELNKKAIDGLIKKNEKYTDELKGKDKVAFVNMDRKKFFRHCFLGFRIKAYKKPEFNKKEEEFISQFPATFEVSIGRNDFIVPYHGEGKKKLVLRMGGFLPFKISDLLSVYVFGTAMLHFNIEKKEEPIIMKPAPADTEFPSVNIAQIPYPDERRDFYQIGIGIEFSEIIKKFFSSNASKKE